MRPLRIAAVLAAAGATLQAQAPGRVNLRVAVPGGVPPGATMSAIPFVVFGAPNTPGVNRNPALGWYWNSSGFRAYPYLYYWGLANNANPVPQGPSYANPAAVQPVGELPPPLVAPAVGSSPEWAEARSSFTAASSKVSAARQAVEELRARLAAIGQSPRASLTTGVTSADSALRAAQQHMTAGELEASRQEIQRANYLASQVLKEFGR